MNLGWIRWVPYDAAPRDSNMLQEIALLVAQYLESRSFGHIAKIIEEQVLERSPGEYEEEVRDVERAIQGASSHMRHTC